jgi:hypothetical protein
LRDVEKFPLSGGRTHAITVPSLAKKSELFIRK